MDPWWALNQRVWYTQICLSKIRTKCEMNTQTEAPKLIRNSGYKVCVGVRIGAGQWRPFHVV